MIRQVALFQFDACEQNRSGNLSRVAEAARVATETSADILVLPEMWPCGYDLVAATAEEGWEREQLAVKELSQQHSLAIVGSMLESMTDSTDPRPANCAFAHEQGKEVARYRKAHLFAPLGEDRTVRAGDEYPQVFRLAGIRVAMAICYDLRFPELFRPAAVAGLDLLVICAQWPEARISQWRALLVARAIENQCFVAGVNRRGLMGETLFGGHSLLVSPTGEVIVDAGVEEGLFYGCIDTAVVNDLRSNFPVLDDCRHDLNNP